MGSVGKHAWTEISDGVIKCLRSPLKWGPPRENIVEHAGKQSQAVVSQAR